jgi:hypothetical protein
MTSPANYVHLGCPNCGWHHTVPANMPAHQVHAELRRMRQDVLSTQLDRSGTLSNATKLVQARREAMQRGNV